MLPSDARPQPLNPGPLAGLSASLLLAALGQSLLSQTLQPMAYGLGVYAVALLLFLLSLRALNLRLPPFRIGAETTTAPAAPLGLWGTSLAFALGAALSAFGPQPNWLTVGAWAVSLGLYAFSAANVSGWRQSAHADWRVGEAWRAWWAAHWPDVLAAVLFGIAALAVRTIQLEGHPYSFVNDEGEVGLEALRILNGARPNFFEPAWASQPVWAFVPAALAVKVLGNTAFAVRIISALAGALTVALVYLLGREWFGRAVGALAATLLLALPWHVHFSRLGVTNINDGLFSTLALWLVFRALRRGTPTAHALAGFAAGAALYTYVGTRLVPVLALASLLVAAWHSKDFFSKQGGAALVWLGAVAVTALPLAAHFIQFSERYFLRVARESIVYNGVLQQQALLTGRSVLAVLLDQFSKSSLVYVAQPAIANFFNSPQPYLTPLAAVAFALGLAYALWHWRDPRCLILLIWFWAVVILGSTLTGGPPTHQRLLMSAPPLVLLTTLGLHQTARALTQAGVFQWRVGLAVCGALAAVTAAQGAWFYFGEYRTDHYFENPGNEISYEAGRAANALGPAYRLYLIAEPRAYVVFASFGFFAPTVEKLDFNAVTEATVAALPRDRGAFFVAWPNRQTDLARIAQWLPGGEWQAVPRRTQPAEMLYYAYRVPPDVFRQSPSGPP